MLSSSPLSLFSILRTYAIVFGNKNPTILHSIIILQDVANCNNFCQIPSFVHLFRTFLFHLFCSTSIPKFHKLLSLRYNTYFYQIKNNILVLTDVLQSDIMFSTLMSHFHLCVSMPHQIPLAKETRHEKQLSSEDVSNCHVSYGNAHVLHVLLFSCPFAMCVFRE